MWSEFKQFISRGNVFDLAVAVIIGSAFGQIVESLVQDMMMPAIGILFGGINFEGLHLRIGAEVIELGKFLGSLVDFLLIAMSVFLMVKVVNHLKGVDQTYRVKQTTNLEVLQEIRDILKDEPRDAVIERPSKTRDILTKSGMKIQMRRSDRKTK
ncbi:large conductance mechanosensitive channel protein MscL [Bacillus sp. AFS015802]|uniref:large conductance mechanosensitive channel protein MscL n=1 Tax=Bacillus sp. AFS015802 TaxID=2033486 RepID=UPI000BF291AB|nr:large conductance mechanosensitive channel protein MscL [Bacillus sp. AFS015802]PFA69500.1 large conductance mechanosensitive channel protein MscL [Bacillus sp. AFS015802]